MILEVVATHDLWINVLQRSPVFSPYLRNYDAVVDFTVNENSYVMGDFIADGIYHEWPAFVKAVRNPVDRKKSLFAAAQEATRKGIE
jgi:hypothetical protein